MPRQARLDIPGALHHIMVRGINRFPIFREDQDKRNFLEHLGQEVTEGKCAVYAWVLRDNHILFKSSQRSISTVMRRLLTWMDAGYVLAGFGKSRRLGRRGYRRFVEEGLGMGRVGELTGGGLIGSLGGWSRVVALRRKGEEGEESDERILGSGDFVQSVLKEVEERRFRQFRVRRRGLSVGDIIKKVR